MSDYTVLDWLAWGIVVVFFGAFVLLIGAIVVAAFGWGVFPVILGITLVSWAIGRVMELV